MHSFLIAKIDELYSVQNQIVCLILIHLDATMRKYRVKIMGLPRDTTVASLEAMFKIPGQGQFVIRHDDSSVVATDTCIAYLRGQSSENHVRMSAYSWTRKAYDSLGKNIRCQAEIDGNDIDHLIEIPSTTERSLNHDIGVQGSNQRLSRDSQASPPQLHRSNLNSSFDTSNMNNSSKNSSKHFW